MAGMTLHSIFPALDLSAEQRAADAVARLATQLAATLATARILLAAGREVDLSGTEHRVGEVCARALDLPPELGRALRATLLLVHAELERTAATLGARMSS